MAGANIHLSARDVEDDGFLGFQVLAIHGHDDILQLFVVAARLALDRHTGNARQIDKTRETTGNCGIPVD